MSFSTDHDCRCHVRRIKCVTNKVVIVTGAGGSGSGRAIARRFAREGAAVVVSDIQYAGGRDTVARIESESGCAAFLQADVRIEEQVRGLIEFAEKTFGGLNVLVNNASGPFRPDEPLEYWTDTAQTDLFGTMYGSNRRHAARRWWRDCQYEFDIRALAWP